MEDAIIMSQDEVGKAPFAISILEIAKLLPE